MLSKHGPISPHSFPAVSLLINLACDIVHDSGTQLLLYALVFASVATHLGKLELVQRWWYSCVETPVAFLQHKQAQLTHVILHHTIVAS